MASCSFISLCRTAKNSRGAGHGIVRATVLMKKFCQTWFTFTFCGTKLPLNCEDSTDLGRGYSINKACGDLTGGLPGDVGLFSIEPALISRWQNQRHLLICDPPPQPPPRLCGGSAHCWMGHSRHQRHGSLMQIPNAIHSVALTFVSKYRRLSRENAGTGAALQL